MKKRRRPTTSGFTIYGLGLVLVSLTCWATLAVARTDQTHKGASEDEPVRADESSVRELMRLETELALQLTRERHRDKHQFTKQHSVPDPVPVSGPVLRAIYGVGHRLTAEIQIGRHIYRYRHNDVRTKRSIDPEGFHLRAIEGHCVTLGEHRTQHRLCLPVTLW